MPGRNEDITKVVFMLTNHSHSASHPGNLERRAALCMNGIQGDFRGMDAADDSLGERRSVLRSTW